MPRNSNFGDHIGDADCILDANLEVRYEHMASLRTTERKSRELQITQTTKIGLRKMYRILQSCSGSLKYEGKLCL
jgi:hypothetical protein